MEGFTPFGTPQPFFHHAPPEGIGRYIEAVAFQELLIGKGWAKVVIMGRYEFQGAFLQAWCQLMVRWPASQPMPYPTRPLRCYAAAHPPHLTRTAFNLLGCLALQYFPIQNILNYSQSINFTHAELYYFGVVHTSRLHQKRTFLKNADRTL
jgi:hypothetical protein